MEKTKQFTEDICHKLLMLKTKQALAFSKEKDYDTWRADVKNKFIELTGINNIKENACPLNFKIENEEQKEGYKQIRFTFESEIGATVPCYLLIPDGESKKYPVAITLQGHKEGGMYNSIGIVKNEDDEEYQPRGAFALQAVREGYAALAIEQRGMGETRPVEWNRKWAQMCEYTAHIALLLGRTVIGERIWDVSKAIDALSNFDCLDLDNIIITGNSGGGTTSYYAACYDERIKLSAPSCAFCTYEQSILDVCHCSCNFIPHIYEWFEMQDLSCLIAPRKLAIISGKDDRIFKIDGVKEGFETVKAIYEKAGVPDNCTLTITPKDHYWCEDIVWNTIKENHK